jgi:GNAT superfamily N-acetyltransferase
MREDAFAKTMRHPLESKFVHEGRSPPAHLFGGWRLVDQEVRGALKTNFSTSDHDVTPWPAGLFVVPEYRRWGAGAVLVRAIEDQAR